MGGLEPISFWDGVGLQILAFFILILLPVIWAAIILFSLVYVILKPCEAKSTIGQAASAILIFTSIPFGLTVVNYSQLCDAIKRAKQPKKPRDVPATEIVEPETADEPSGRRSELQTAADNSEPQKLVPEPCRALPPLAGDREPRWYPRLSGVNDFRLLIISPGSTTSPLSGELVTASFSGNLRPSYDALSYTWADETGDADRSANFFCEGDNNGNIRITKNCETALQRLRLLDEKRWVWVDAICINQSSEVERNYQVSMMSKIYRSARRVVVYTGEGTAHTDKLFDWLNELRTEDLEILLNWDLSNLAGDVVISLEKYWSVGRERLLALFHDPGAGKQKINITESELVELASEYFSRRWFQRVWVLQEVALPDVRNISVICGTKTISALRALHALSLIYMHSSASMIRIFVLLRKKTKGCKKSHLLDVLIETRDREAGDPRDKIFGVLSISHYLDDGKYPELKANYEMSMPEVYAHYSVFFIEHYGPGFFLSLIKSPSSLSQLPSWAADWTVPWPNYKAVSGRDFAAASRPLIAMDSGVQFTKENGYHVLTLIRSRIVQGYFTRNGHIDGVNDATIEGLEGLREGELLIEIYPGLAALLKREDEYYIFTQVCPHALSEDGVEELVGRWSSVVVDAKGPKDQIGLDPKFSEHLGLVDTFKIR